MDPNATEAALVSVTGRRPVTAGSLERDLRALGVAPGATLLVHASLSALGWIAGGVPAVVAALDAVLGETGTLMMPAHTGHLSEPSRWRFPPVPEAWWPTIRAELPAFEADLTPTRGMGALAEAFRRYPRVIRSGHPQTSFAARGPNAATLTADHNPGCALGETSPLGRLYALDGHVLLLGVGHGNNTSLHLAEHRARFPGKQFHTEGAPVLIDGKRRWIEFDELVTDDGDFPVLGAAFGETGDEVAAPVGIGTGRLMRQRALVDFAVGWMEGHR